MVTAPAGVVFSAGLAMLSPAGSMISPDHSLPGSSVGSSEGVSEGVSEGDVSSDGVVISSVAKTA